MTYEQLLQENKELKSNDLYRIYFEADLIGMTKTSLEKGWVDVNKKICDMLGYTKEELLNLSWQELTYEEDLQKDIEQFNRVLKGEIDGYFLEKRFVKKTGEIIYTELSVQCVRNSDGSVNYFIALLQDVTDKKNAQQEINDQKNYINSLMNAQSNIVISSNKSKLKTGNKAFFNFFNVNDEKEFIKSFGESISDTFDTTAPTGFIQKKMEEESWIEYVYKRPEKTHKVMIKNKNNKHIFTITADKFEFKGETLEVAVFTEITQLEQTLVQLEDSKQELEDSNYELETTIENLKRTKNQLVESEKMASLGGLVAGVAHEINTPIGIGLTASSHLSLTSEELKKKYKNEQMSQKEFEEYLDDTEELTALIETNLRRTSDLVKSFKQVAVDQISEEKRVFKLKEYTKGILFSLNNILKKKDITMNIHCDDSLKLDSYPGFYSQILTNLIINSFRHGFKDRKKGEINIDIKLENGELNLIYKDDGIGIPKQNISKIFDPFFTTNREAGGTGLGLNIIYNIITNKLKGKIKCIDTNRDGAEFRIRLNIS